MYNFHNFTRFSIHHISKAKKNLKTEIEELKSNNKDIINFINQKSTFSHTEKYDNKNKDSKNDNKLKTNDFSAETINLSKKNNISKKAKKKLTLNNITNNNSIKTFSNNKRKGGRGTIISDDSFFNNSKHRSSIGAHNE